MVNVEAKLIFTVVMAVFALAVWVAKRRGDSAPLIKWVKIWVPRFEFTEDRIGKRAARQFYLVVFGALIVTVWLFD